MFVWSRNTRITRHCPQGVSNRAREDAHTQYISLRRLSWKKFKALHWAITVSLRPAADKWCQKGERGPRRWLRKENHLTGSFALCLAGNNTDRCFICLWLGEGFRFWLYGCWLQTDKKFRFCLFSWKAWRYHLENPMAFSISLTNLWCLLRVMPVRSWLCSQRSWWKLNNTAPTGQLVPRQETVLSCRKAMRGREGGALSKAGLCSHSATVFIIVYRLHLASANKVPAPEGKMLDTASALELSSCG